MIRDGVGLCEKKKKTFSKRFLGWVICRIEREIYILAKGSGLVDIYPGGTAAFPAGMLVVTVCGMEQCRLGHARSRRCSIILG